jgi:hypothetical protein
VRSVPGEARTILLLQIISARPSKQPYGTYLPQGIWSSAPILFLQEQIKGIIIINGRIYMSQSSGQRRISFRVPHKTPCRPLARALAMKCFMSNFMDGGGGEGVCVYYCRT